MQNRNRIETIRHRFPLMALAIVMILLMGYSPWEEAPGDQPLKDKKITESTMFAYASASQQPVLPPIDMDIPAQIGTASFGLG